MNSLFLGTIFGPCWDYIQPRSPPNPAKTLTFSRLTHIDPVNRVQSLHDHVRTMIGPCWCHDIPRSPPKPAKTLKFSRLNQNFVRSTPLVEQQVSIKCTNPVRVYQARKQQKSISVSETGSELGTTRYVMKLGYVSLLLWQNIALTE